MTKTIKESMLDKWLLEASEGNTHIALDRAIDETLAEARRRINNSYVCGDVHLVSYCKTCKRIKKKLDEVLR